MGDGAVQVSEGDRARESQNVSVDLPDVSPLSVSVSLLSLFSLSVSPCSLLSLPPLHPPPLPPPSPPHRQPDYNPGDCEACQELPNVACYCTGGKDDPGVYASNACKDGRFRDDRSLGMPHLTHTPTPGDCHWSLVSDIWNGVTGDAGFEGCMNAVDDSGVSLFKGEPRRATGVPCKIAVTNIKLLGDWKKGSPLRDATNNCTSMLALPRQDSPRVNHFFVSPFKAKVSSPLFNAALQ